MSSTAGTRSAKTPQLGEKKYRERAQPASRRRFGLLEKRKDWQARAQDYKKKRENLEKLKRTAQQKNPDEFYMGMVGRNLQNGILKEQKKKGTKNSLDVKYNFADEEEEDKYLDNLLNKYKDTKPDDSEASDKVDFEEESLRRSYDLNFVRMRLQTESKKLDRMKRSLQFTSANPEATNIQQSSNAHTYFASDDEEAELIQQKLQKKREEASTKQTELSEFKTDEGRAAHKMLTQYKQLAEQIDRVDSLRGLHDKLQSRRAIANDARPCKILRKEDDVQNGVYFWPTRRYK